MHPHQQVWCGLFLLACAAVSGASATPSMSLVVTTNKGPVTGIQTPTIRKFLGIPYAAAPVGALRWQPPRPHARWSKKAPRDATQFGNHCPQPTTPFGTASDSEDCLYLNVFAPNDTSRHPVMVWIHGGALWLGEGDNYDPTKLMEQGVVVVTINYRLGILGFLSHPALTAEKPHHAPGNYGLMDQQSALKWVKQNIAHFGGDPHNVTIFGESAGGLSVHSQLASRTAKGLFHKAIVESGAYSLAQPTLAEAETRGSAFATAAGCTDQSAACLRALSVAQVLTAQGFAPTGFVPTVDGKVLTRSIGTAFSSGKFNQVPVIEGSNHDEWRLFVALYNASLTAEQYPSAIATTLGISPAEASAVLVHYPLSNYPSPWIALGAVGTDGMFACNARTAAQLLSQHVPTFAYEFNDANAPQIFLPPASFPYGAYHAAEIQYLFGVTATFPAALDADQQELADTMVGYWTQFARSSNPNSSGAPSWPQYQAAMDERQSLVPPLPEVESGFAVDHQCAFWDSLGG